MLDLGAHEVAWTRSSLHDELLGWRCRPRASGTHLVNGSADKFLQLVRHGEPARQATVVPIVVFS